MRAICLGVFHSIILEAFWRTPECRGTVSQHLDQTTRRTIALDTFILEYSNWCQEQRTEKGRRPVEVSNPTVDIFGNATKRGDMSLKAAEASWMFEFVATTFIPKCAHLLSSGRVLQECSSHLFSVARAPSRIARRTQLRPVHGAGDLMLETPRSSRVGGGAL
eukprot:927300-Pyramimonas_sp.AAC.1